MADLHLPEFRVTVRILGIDPKALNGFYTRAESEEAAVRKAVASGMRGHGRRFDVVRWKEPLYRDPSR